MFKQAVFGFLKSFPTATLLYAGLVFVGLARLDLGWFVTAMIMDLADDWVDLPRDDLE